MRTVGGRHAWKCVYFKSHKLKCLDMKMKRLTRVRLKWLDLTIGLKNEERTMQPGRKQQEQTEARCCHFTLCVSWQNGPKTRHKKPTERSLSPCWNVAVTRQLVLYIQAVWPHSEHEKRRTDGGRRTAGEFRLFLGKEARQREAGGRERTWTDISGCR